LHQLHEKIKKPGTSLSQNRLCREHLETKFDKKSINQTVPTFGLKTVSLTSTIETFPIFLVVIGLQN